MKKKVLVVVQCIKVLNLKMENADKCQKKSNYIQNYCQRVPESID